MSAVVSCMVPSRLSRRALTHRALLLGGGLTALQTMAVSTGFPFTIILLVACYAIIKGLMSEPKAV